MSLRDNPDKTWRPYQATDSWQVWKIVSEFVQGYEIMASMGPSITVFGSARLKPEEERYQLATRVAEVFSRAGYAVITGGGPGVMEAANRGAYNAEGVSSGVHIKLPGEMTPNAFIDRDYLIEFDYFFVRKVMLLKYAQAYLFLPGGLGTLDEFFEAMTLMQTHKIKRFPVVLFDKSYWSGLLDWLKNQVLEAGYIDPEDLDLFHMVEEPEEALKVVQQQYGSGVHRPNF